jgi:hypothetical protein
MSDHAGFGWVLLVLGLVIVGIGLVWILGRRSPGWAACQATSALSGRVSASTSRW